MMTMFTIADFIAKVENELTENAKSRLATLLDDMQTDHDTHTEKPLTLDGINTFCVAVNKALDNSYYELNVTKDINGICVNKGDVMAKVIHTIAPNIHPIDDSVDICRSNDKIPTLAKVLTKSEKERITDDFTAYLNSEISKNELCRRYQSLFGIDGKVIHKEFKSLVSDMCTKTGINPNTAKVKKSVNTASLVNALSKASHWYSNRTAYTVDKNSLAIDIDFKTDTVITEKAVDELTKGGITRKAKAKATA